MGGIIHTIIFFCFGEQIFRDSKINQKFPSSALGLDKKKIWRFPLIDFFYLSKSWTPYSMGGVTKTE